MNAPRPHRFPKGLTGWLALTLLAQVLPASLSAQTTPSVTAPLWEAPHAGNPILPGYYADPSIVQVDGKNYIYATIDPWGGDTLGCWESPNFKDWTFRQLNWPTKSACRSPSSAGSKVWAPSVVRGRDGKFYMAVSVGSEVWVGGADHPLGPWRNLLGDKPLISKDFFPGYHMIDAELFLDDDGSTWIYWGSGLNWVNGRCWGVKLKPDMCSFDGDAKEITPANYFEAPFMIKHNGRYFLSYSNGNTTKDTYEVRYAVGDHPLGPFKEASNSPLLVGDKVRNVVSPGHHAFFIKDGIPYILYHRSAIPTPSQILRQTCVDRITFTPNGLIEKVVPTHVGPPLVQGRNPGRQNLASPTSGVRITASSQEGAAFTPERVCDDNYATRWAAAKAAHGGWLQLDFGKFQRFQRQELRFEYAWKNPLFAVETSDDGERWKTLADYTASPAPGSPVVIEQPGLSRYVRLRFPEKVTGADISLFEWAVY